jgi:hypothetical protein
VGGVVSNTTQPNPTTRGSNPIHQANHACGRPHPFEATQIVIICTIPHALEYRHPLALTACCHTDRAHATTARYPRHRTYRYIYMYRDVLYKESFPTKKICIRAGPDLGWSSRADAQSPQNVRAPTKYIFKYSAW